MLASELLTWIEIGISVGGFFMMLSFYRAAFNQHEKILNRYEKILDRHEIAINVIVNRLDDMNSEISFLKGLGFNK